MFIEQCEGCGADYDLSDGASTHAYGVDVYVCGACSDDIDTIAYCKAQRINAESAEDASTDDAPTVISAHNHPAGCDCLICSGDYQGNPLDYIVIDEQHGIYAPDVPAHLLSDDTLQQIDADEIPF